MTTVSTPTIALTGILCALAGSAALSVNDLLIKFLSGGYALHQVILIRSFVGLFLLTSLITVWRSGFAQLRTRRPRAHLFRVALVMFSNLAFFLGLAALPLADAIAIAFVSPLLVTLMSVLFLGEQVGPRRWTAVAAGMIGVVVIVRPGSGVFQPASLLILAAAVTYAGTQIMTRHMRETETAVSMNFYVQCGFLLTSICVGLIAGNGQFAGSTDPSIAFLLRGWHWPPAGDWPVILGTGLAVTTGGLLITQAYRLAPAGTIAPFEYTAMPFAILWGITVFGTWPDRTTMLGIALIIGAGLYALRREAVRKEEALQ